MDEIVAYVFLQQLKRKGSAIEAEERRSARDFSVEDIDIIHDVLLGVTLHKGHSASSWEGWLGILHDVLASDQDATSFSSSEILVRTKEGEIYLVVYFEIELMMAAIGSTIDTEQHLLMLSYLF